MDAEYMLIALGGNLASTSGEPAETLHSALEKLELAGVTLHAVSPFYGTPAFPPGSGPDFVNAAARVGTALSPAGLLELCHRIEAELGRVRTTRWGQRTLDIDLIGAGDAVLPDRAIHEAWRCLTPDAQQSAAPDTLILPHPRMQDRAFVLVPLADVAPDWVHPVLGQTVTELRDALDPADLAAVRRLE